MDGVGLTRTWVRDSGERGDSRPVGLFVPSSHSAQRSKDPTRKGLQQPGSTKPKSESKSRGSKGHSSPGERRRAIPPSAP